MIKLFQNHAILGTSGGYMCIRYYVTTRGIECSFSMILVLTAGLNREQKVYTSIPVGILRQFKRVVRKFVLKVNASEASWKKLTIKLTLVFINISLFIPPTCRDLLWYGVGVCLSVCLSDCPQSL